MATLVQQSMELILGANSAPVTDPSVLINTNMPDPNGGDLQELQNGTDLSDKCDPNTADLKYTDLMSGKPIKIVQKVIVPVKQYPKFNFVGKLLGPKGNSLKRLQEETLTKMAILGRGSMRDKKEKTNKTVSNPTQSVQVEETKRTEGGKYAHLNEDLHVLVEAFAPPAEAHSRISHALTELKRYLVPDYNDSIRQQQMEELAYLNGEQPRIRATPRPPAPGTVAQPGIVPRPALRGRGAAVAGRGRGIPPPARIQIARTAAAAARFAEEEYYDAGYEEGYEEYDTTFPRAEEYYEYATEAFDNGFGDATNRVERRPVKTVIARPAGPRPHPYIRPAAY